MANYDIYKNTMKAYLGEEADEFIAWLDTTDANVAPSSIKHTMSTIGGWAGHSVNVLQRLIKIVKMEYGEDFDASISKKSIVKVALLHDLYKINRYEQYLRNVKDANGQWIQVADYKVKEKFEHHINNNFTSVVIANRFFKLTDDEIEAIYYSTPNDDLKGSDDFNVGHLANMLRYAIKWALDDEKAEENK